jgi:cob(I)alamin adenosyltransferase
VVARRTSIANSAVATGKGDDGTTGLLYGGRVNKDDPRTDAYGAIDESVAAMGVARAASNAAGLTELADLLLRYQRELFVVGAELATNPTAVDRLTDGVTRVTEQMLNEVEADLARWEARVEMPKEFVVPGETAASAALEVARTVVRRAERRIVALDRALEIGSPWIIPYVNRLADLVWVLARAAEQAEHADATPARVRT